MGSSQVYVYSWGKYRPEWKGRRCRVVARARRMNSVLVEFVDGGERAVVSRYALRRV
ncbi:MAG TPA: hypothetical protein VD997_09770 [Phycisphaerales bacterium]|nr:hypothetical protein [Phycisphaerales bacterium]